MPVTLQAQPDLQDIPAFHQQSSGNFRVAQTEQAIVGTIGPLDIGQAQAALRKVLVARSHRGREHDVAKQRLDVLLDWSVASDIAEICLGTTDEFFAAHRFHPNNGFVEVTRAALPDAFPVVAVDTTFYRRRLGRHAP